MPRADGTVYSFDSSSLIHAWRRAYPPTRFTGIWRAFDQLIEEGRMLASIEVYRELQRKDDDIFAWAKERKDTLIREIDDVVQTEVVRLMGAYPRLVDTVSGKSGADPFVIAQAQSQNPPMVIVSQESGGSERSPKIPFVCNREGIRCINLLGLLETEDWRF